MAWLVPAVLVAFVASCYPNPDDLRSAGGGGGGVNGAAGQTGSSCSNPSYPKNCPALDGAPAGCWAADTVCSTVTTCNGDPVACKSASLKVYCAGDSCCTPPAATGTCNIPDCGCATGQVCYPSTEATGLACFATGNLGEGADCSSSTAGCASGYGCFGGTCKSYCTANSDCPSVQGVQFCLQATWITSGNPISGVEVCERVCDPATPQTPRSPFLTCPAGFGCDVTSTAGVTYCSKRTKTGAAGTACSTANGSNDCAPGLYCSTGALCRKFCFTNSDCPGGTCQIFSPAYYAGTQPLGGCSP